MLFDLSNRFWDLGWEVFLITKTLCNYRSPIFARLPFLRLVMYMVYPTMVGPLVKHIKCGVPIASLGNPR